MLAYLIGILSEDIEIELSPECFYFKRSGQIINVRTVIFISADGKPRVLAVGDENIPAEPCYKIELFKAEQPAVASIDKAECLEEYFRYCINRIVGRKALIRPRMVFKNAASLGEILGGYEKMILKVIGINSGARECLFHE